MKKLIIITVVIISGMCNAQNICPLELSNCDTYPSFLIVHRCFDKELNCLLLESSSHQGAYYMLNIRDEKIVPISIDKSFYPISFFSDDTLLVRNNLQYKYFLYDVKNQKIVEDGDGTLPSILSEIPFNACRNMIISQESAECIYWNDSVVLRIKILQHSSKTSIDTILVVEGSKHITNVCLCADTMLFINIFDELSFKETTCLFNIWNKRILRERCDYLIGDCRGNYCIVWKEGKCTLCFYDGVSQKMVKENDIIVSVGQLFGRVGFVSDLTIAWYTSSSLDYSTFEPLLNQQRLLKITTESKNDKLW